jgi:predicted ATP-dependent serine protease
MSQRLRAAADYVPGVSDARALTRMAWKSTEHLGAYEDLRLGAGALVLVSGPPGSGKSTWASRLINAVHGPALLIAAEEGISPSLAARLLRSNVKREDFHVLTRATVDAAVAFAKEHKIVATAIDSVQEAAWTASELRHLLEMVPTMDLLVGVVQVTKAGLPAGAMALQHEADVCVTVEGMTWALAKSRYQDLADVGGAILPRQEEESRAAS